MELVYPPDREKLAKQFKEQRNEGKILQLEYRLVAKDGHTVWVSDHCLITVENGAEVAYCVILDAARHHQAEEELRLSLERHNIIMEQTNDIIFEWDIRNDELYLSPKWKSQYGYQPITKNVSSEIPRISHIHPDDVPVFQDLMQTMRIGIPYKEAEFRIADGAGVYRWRLVRATAQFDIDNKPFKAVGVIVISIHRRQRKRPWRTGRHAMCSPASITRFLPKAG